MTVIPFRLRRAFPGGIVLGALAAALLASAAISAFFVWQDEPHAAAPHEGASHQAIKVIDGDTVRLDGNTYPLVGFNTPEKADLARCQDERRRADAATNRLKAVIATGDARLNRADHD